MKNNVTFAETLNRLRKANNLTVDELGRRAGVYPSLISSVQTGNRQIGEYVARKLAKVLDLAGEELEDFVYLAINECTVKVLERCKEYPAEVLCLVANELYNQGIAPESIMRCVRKPATATLCMNDGKESVISLESSVR